MLVTVKNKIDEGLVHRVAAIHLFEQLQLGFRLEVGVPLWHQLGAVPPACRPVEIADSSLRNLAAFIADSFATGAALELTGGVDSRLLLAMGLAAGERPHLAFTLGEPGHPDVVVARSIANRFGIRHLTIPVRIEPDSIVDDARTFVEASGCVCNAIEYAWLPAVLRRLSNEREQQVGGSGGEIGEGFYYSPLDKMMQVWPNLEIWRSSRLNLSGSLVRDLFAPARHIDLRHRSSTRLRAALGNGSLPWRSRLDHLYRDVRIPNWANPCLRACRRWYKPIAPFLTHDYLRWSAQLPLEMRSGRRGQRELIARLHSELASIPFATDLGSRSGTSGVASRTTARARRVRRIAQQILGRRRDASAMMRGAAAAIAKDQTSVESIRRLVQEDHLGLHPQGVERVLNHPIRFAHEFGALLTAAWSRGL